MNISMEYHTATNLNRTLTLNQFAEKAVDYYDVLWTNKIKTE